MQADTIVAISTPPGRGGIGIVRLSGPAARGVAGALIRLGGALEPGRVRFGHVAVGDAVLDEAVVTFYAAPHSYTGEDVVEIACHGSPVVLAQVLAACVAGSGSASARLAEPGEFTRRAFLSGRLDLTQAEAVDDLIAATSVQGAKLAAAQLGGAVAEAVRPHKQALVELIAELEAGIDFAEDDLDVLAAEQVAPRIAALYAPIAALAATYAYGRVVREGLSLAIVGRPNAGKSSLFNRLVGRDRAIVTAQPGTTRDLIEETLEIDGIPVRLVDTAGMRVVPEGTEGEAERMGIRRTYEAIADADLVLVAMEAGADLDETSPLLAGLRGRPCLMVRTKSDLAAQDVAAQDWAAKDLTAQEAGGDVGLKAIRTSARTGEGIGELRREIVQAVASAGHGSEAAIVTSLRQHEALRESVGALERANTAAAKRLPHEMLLLDLYAALEALDRLTGATSNEDVLRLIFSKFCIGK